MGKNAFNFFAKENRKQVKDSGFTANDIQVELGRRWKELTTEEKHPYVEKFLASIESQTTASSERTAYYHRQIKNMDRGGDRKADCIHCERRYVVFSKVQDSSKLMNSINVNCIMSHLLTSCTTKGIEALIVGALLDRGNKNYDNYFEKGTKRRHYGEIAQRDDLEDFDFVAQIQEDFDPIEIAINEALPESTTCCCEEVFDKSTKTTTMLRGHIQNFCSVFGDWRPFAHNLQSDNYLHPDLIELRPFTSKAPAKSKDACFYIHWRYLVPLLWPDLFVEENLSYGGLIKELKNGNKRGFRGRYHGHRHYFAINPGTEQMIALAKGPGPLIRRVEACFQALYNDTKCALKNGKVEVLPLISLSRQDADNSCRSVITLLRHFYDDMLTMVDPDVLRENRQAYINNMLVNYQI